MSRVLLISEEHIKAESIIESNVDPKILQKVIINVQEIQLKGILGADLYNSILADVTNVILDSSYVMSDYNKTLLDDYIIPFLVHATVVEFIIVNNYKLSNKGVMKLNDNNASSTSSVDVEYVKNYYDNYAAVFKARLIKHLKLNTETVPTTGKTDKDLTSAAIGWYLDTNRDNCYDYHSII